MTVASGLPGEARHGQAGMQVELVEEEVVGVYSSQVERRECIVGEITQVEGHDDLRAGADGGAST
jgi:hypothetical protein